MFIPKTNISLEFQIYFSMWASSKQFNTKTNMLNSTFHELFKVLSWIQKFKYKWEEDTQCSWWQRHVSIWILPLLSYPDNIWTKDYITLSQLLYGVLGTEINTSVPSRDFIIRYMWKWRFTSSLNSSGKFMGDEIYLKCILFFQVPLFVILLS